MNNITVSTQENLGKKIGFHELPPRTLSIVDPQNQPLKEENHFKISKLINSLNRINFHGETILVHFKHRKYNQTVSLPAQPLPCSDKQLDCLWTDAQDFDDKLSNYQFLNFSLSDGLNQILVNADINNLGKDGISLTLPQKGGDIVSNRKHKRSRCQEVAIQLFQDGACYKGTLLDFCINSFSAKIINNPSENLNWINHHNHVYVILSKSDHVIYSGLCKIVRHTNSLQNSTLVLQPINNQIQRFRTKKTRSDREKLTPSPNIVFTHPLTGDKINLSVIDISGSGLAVEENLENAVLLPGMMLPKLGIELMNARTLNCIAQIIYSKQTDENTVKCGLTFLDMNTEDHITLSNLICRANDNNSHINSTNMDLNELWNFFFEAGFIYPHKFTFVKNKQEKYRKLYEKLYTQSPNIARHFIYQERGKICGHIAMLRTYKKSWLFHHHAAITDPHNKAGIAVLQQIGSYTNSFHSLQSSNMDYIISYYRPNNRFPSKAFGDLARNLQNPKGSSLDTFAYFQFKRNSLEEKITKPWSLDTASPNDLEELKKYYEHNSGGLMIQALNLDPLSGINDLDINKEYENLGFKRERFLYSLKDNGKLQAIFMINVSDTGLNMSELTNCIHAFVLDTDNLKREAFDVALNMLTHHYEGQSDIPAMLYPATYAEDQQIPSDKKYHLWVLNLKYTDAYFKHMDKLLKSNRRTSNDRREQSRRKDNLQLIKQASQNKSPDKEKSPRQLSLGRFLISIR